MAPAAAEQLASSFPQPEILSSLQTVYMHRAENHVSWAQWVFTQAVNSLLMLRATISFICLP